MRMICAHISSQVGAKFGREDRVRALGIGAYVFLRMLCPTFLAPEKAVTISRAVEAHHLRTFILVSKVIQNLANQVLFGKKEVFMLPLNAVVKSQQERVNTFLLEMAQIPPAPGDGGGKKPIDSDAMNAIQSLAQSSKASLAETPMYSKQTTLNVGVYVSFLTQLSLTKLTPPSTSCIYGETGNKRALMFIFVSLNMVTRANLNHAHASVDAVESRSGTGRGVGVFGFSPGHLRCAFRDV